MVGDVRDVLARGERYAPETGAIRSAGEGPRAGKGSGARQPHRDNDVRVRKRREDAGWDTFYGTCPASRRTVPASAGAMRGAERRGRTKSDGSHRPLSPVPAGIEGESSRSG